jgi:hypothetical protein
MIVTGRALAVLAFDWANSSLPYGVGLTIVLAIGAMAIALVKRWRQRDASISMSPSEQLAEYRSLYDEGVMSKEEFDRLRALLGGQLREAPVPVPPPEPTTNVLLRREPPPVQPPSPPSSENVQLPPSAETGNGQT